MRKKGMGGRDCKAVEARNHVNCILGQNRYRETKVLEKLGCLRTGDRMPGR